MPQTRPFTQLKKPLEALFVPGLDLRVDCLAWANRTLHSVLKIPRYTVKLNGEVIWDFPKDFPLKRETPQLWKDMADISALIRDYIDAPVVGLTEHVFERDHINFTYQYLGTDIADEYEFQLGLTPLFIAADRRIGKERLRTWAKRIHSDSAVHRVLAARSVIAP